MATLTVPVSDADHIRGPATAPVTIVEYGDYQCPHCGAAYPIVERLLAHFGDRVRLVFRHFPLQTIHADARRAAQAAEAAACQGRFWEMHALLFQNQKQLDEASILGYAAQLGLDLARFQNDLASEETWKPVRCDFEEGFRSGVNRTPTFFIQGTRYDGPTRYDDLEAAIQAAINAQVAGGDPISERRNQTCQ